MKQYEVHWSELYSVDHFNTEWDDRNKKFTSKKEAVDFARVLCDREDVDFIRVYKVIDHVEV